MRHRFGERHAHRQIARGSDPVRAGRDRWLMSYADLVTLLLACFATAYASAYTPPELRRGNTEPAPPTATVHVAVAESAPTAPAPAAPVDAIPPITPVAPIAPVPSLRALIAPIVIVAGSHLDLIEDSRGVVISLPESATFPRGSATLTSEARTFLMQLADTLRPTSARLRIEGHTDDVPLTGGKYATNWELSTARASAVVMFLVNDGSLAPQRLSAAGFGEFQPRAPNDTAEHQALNRRVDVVVTDVDTGEQP